MTQSTAKGGRSQSSTDDGATGSVSSGSEQDSPFTAGGGRCPPARCAQAQQQCPESPQRRWGFGAPTTPAPWGGGAQAAPGAAAPGAAGCQSLRDALQHLHQLGDNDRILALRRVRHLGTQAESLLRAHFELWGPVVAVLTYPVFKGSAGKTARLGDLAFVVMAAKSDAAHVLEAVESVCVAGYAVEVAPFRRSMGAPLD